MIFVFLWIYVSTEACNSRATLLNNFQSFTCSGSIGSTMGQYIWLATVCFLVLSLNDLSKAEGHCSIHRRCEGRESITFKALIGHTFITLQTQNPEQCHERCREDIRCQSLNFVIRNGLCELNNRSKETNPQHFVFDAERFYFRRWPIGKQKRSDRRRWFNDSRGLDTSSIGISHSYLFWMEYWLS